MEKPKLPGVCTDILYFVIYQEIRKKFHLNESIMNLSTLLHNFHSIIIQKDCKHWQ